MQSVQKIDSQHGREQITMRVWRETYSRLKELKEETGTPIVKLIDRGVKLLEQKEEHER